MKTTMEQLNEAEALLHGTKGLVEALQIVLWEFCQEEIRGNPSLTRQRAALIALGDAMELTLKDYY